MSEVMFSKKHMWVERDGDRARIGITDYAEEKLGNILFLNLPDRGDEIEAGFAFGDIESVKTVSDLIAPISGIVVDVNDDLIDEPDVINENPYASWLVEANVKQEKLDLMNKSEYEEYIKSL